MRRADTDALRYMAVGQVRLYIKDYPRVRRADQEKPFRILRLDAKATVARVFIKPHGRLLSDGRIICWGRAADWKAILMAAFERGFTTPDAKPYTVFLTESSGKYAESSVRALVAEAAKRLHIEKLVWDS